MEEKERYRYIVATNKLYDSQEDELYFYNINSNKVISILNQQDREIKQLKKELSKYKSYKTTEERIRDLENLYSDYKKENQQLNEHIKELELLLNADNKMKTNSIKGFEKLKQENLQLKERLSLKMEELHIAYCGIEEVKTKNGNLKAEIQQLKQSQKQLAIEVLEKFKSELVNKTSPIQLSYMDYVKQVYDKINNQIKELKGEK